MSITRWDPARDFVSLREAMDRLFEGSVIRAKTGDGRGTSFPVDLYETEDAFVLKASLPGVRPDDLDVSATSDAITIRAELRPDGDVRQESWMLQERLYGTLQRSFTLPTEIDPNQVEATFEHGVLTLKLAKAEAARPKQIKVKTAGTDVEAQSR